MVRTKATVNTSVRVSGAKAPRKFTAPSCHSIDSSSSGNKKDKLVGANPVCPRPTPDWQKPIATFFTVVSREKTEVKSSSEEFWSSLSSLKHPPYPTIPLQRANVENFAMDIDLEDGKIPAQGAEISVDEDKENINPEQDVEVDDEAGPSGSSSVSHVSEPKKRRKILKMFDSDSEEEKSDVVSNTSGCIVAIEDKISTCSD